MLWERFKFTLNVYYDDSLCIYSLICEDRVVLFILIYLFIYLFWVLWNFIHWRYIVKKENKSAISENDS